MTSSSPRALVAVGRGACPCWSLPRSRHVCDRGDRLGGWLRLRYGRGAQPHQLSLMTHPDDPDVGPALVRLGLRGLGREPRAPSSVRRVSTKGQR